MKTILTTIKYLLILFICVIGLTSCPENVSGVEHLCIKNKSNKEMFFWYSKEYTAHHYPDTLLSIEIPLQVRGAGSGGCVGGMEGHITSWEDIYSQLPAGLFSVYFFDVFPSNQEEWNMLRNSPHLIHRKDFSFAELEANNYTIEYP